jgi:hypothetical protein
MPYLVKSDKDRDTFLAFVNESLNGHLMALHVSSDKGAEVMGKWE